MSRNRPPLNDTNNKPGIVDLGSIPGGAPVASFNKDGIENLIETKGFLGVHYKHALIPNRDQDNSPTFSNTQAAHRGHRYFSPRWIYHVPRQYSIEDILTAQGVFESGSVLMNMAGYYSDEVPDKSNEAFFRPRDLFVFPSLTDVTEQTFEYNPTGPQKLQYQISSVELLFDSAGREFVCDEDFQISNGLIEWLPSGKKPGFKDGQGDVLSIVYYFVPIYIITNLMHSLRVIPSNKSGHAAEPREAVYAPQQMICKPSTIVEEGNLIDWKALPPYPEYPASKNTTGGSV